MRVRVLIAIFVAALCCFVGVEAVSVRRGSDGVLAPMGAPIMHNGYAVDTSAAAVTARAEAVAAVEDTLAEHAGSPRASISERHLEAGRRAHAKMDEVREAFQKHQNELEHKDAIAPEHRFAP